MAGDWIKFEKATLDKPEVFDMAVILEIDPDAVVGKLLRVWNWFDDQSLDGNASVTVRALLDRYSGVTGFTEAMESVGWLIVEGESMTLPNFDRHNGQTAKTRALTAKRVTKSKAKSNAKGNASTVTSIVTPSLPENRIEDNRIEEKEEVSCPSPDEKTILALIWGMAPAKAKSRSSKKQVTNEWKKIKTADRPSDGDLCQSFTAWTKSDDWTKDRGEFVPGLHLWFKNRKWEDVPEPSKGNTNNRTGQPLPSQDKLMGGRTASILKLNE